MCFGTAVGMNRPARVARCHGGLGGDTDTSRGRVPAGGWTREVLLLRSVARHQPGLTAGPTPKETGVWKSSASSRAGTRPQPSRWWGGGGFPPEQAVRGGKGVTVSPREPELTQCHPPSPPGAVPTWAAEAGDPRPSPSAKTVTNLASWCMSWATSSGFGTSTHAPTAMTTSPSSGRTSSQVGTSLPPPPHPHHPCHGVPPVMSPSLRRAGVQLLEDGAGGGGVAGRDI